MRYSSIAIARYSRSRIFVPVVKLHLVYLGGRRMTYVGQFRQLEGGPYYVVALNNINNTNNYLVRY